MENDSARQPAPIMPRVLINLQLRNKKMLRNESCDPLKIDAAVNKASIIGVTRKPILRISFLS